MPTSSEGSILHMQPGMVLSTSDLQRPGAAPGAYEVVECSDPEVQVLEMQRMGCLTKVHTQPDLVARNPRPQL